MQLRQLETFVAIYQLRSVSRAAEKLGYPVELIVPQGVNHFDVVNQLRDPGCDLVRLQLAEMKKAFRR